MLGAELRLGSVQGLIQARAVDPALQYFGRLIATDIESAPPGEAHGSALIYQKAVGHDVEAVELPQEVLLVNDRGESCLCIFSVRAGLVRALGVQCDRQNLDAALLERLVPLLPYR